MANPQNLAVGVQAIGDGAVIPARGGKLGDAIVSELQGRFYEATYRNAKFAGGISALTSIANATFTVATLGVTCTPIIGVWNPATSPVNLVILQAVLDAILTALQATGAGGFVWASSLGNSANMSTAVSPWNRKSLAKAGSYGKDLSGLALTGLVNNLVVMHAAALGGGPIYNASLLGTAAGFMTAQAPSVENFDGSLIVPPGGVLALLANTTPVAISATSAILWDEVPT